jgi:hypothetical protein
MLILQKTSSAYQSFIKYYLSDVGAEISLKSIAKFDESINSRFDESIPVNTKNVKTIYLSRNISLDGKKAKDENNLCIMFNIYVEREL